MRTGGFGAASADSRHLWPVRLVAGGDIVLGHLALVDDLLLCQEVSNIGLLQEGVALVFLVGED